MKNQKNDAPPRLESRGLFGARFLDARERPRLESRGFQRSRHNKIRVNITVDKELVEKAKTKLNLFGGKLSTLFNAYLADFVESMGKDFSEKENILKIKELEERIKKLEERIRRY